MSWAEGILLVCLLLLFFLPHPKKKKSSPQTSVAKKREELSSSLSRLQALNESRSQRGPEKESVRVLTERTRDTAFSPSQPVSLGFSLFEENGLRNMILTSEILRKRWDEDL